jgi:hypothetical protein
MSCYLLIISNLIIKLLIAIYFVLNFFFSISSLRIWFNLIFIFILDRNYFSKVVKNLEMSYYLLIILNLILKLLIVIYFILIFFSISSFRIWCNLIFISILVFIFMIVIFFSFINFLIKIFYLSDLVFILLIVIYFIWNNLWNCNLFLISSSFNFLSIRFYLHYFDCYLFYLR